MKLNVKALKIIFFPPIALLVGAAIGVGIGLIQGACISPEDYEVLGCDFAVMVSVAIGAATGFGVGLVVYVAWGLISWLQRIEVLPQGIPIPHILLGATLVCVLVMAGVLLFIVLRSRFTLGTESHAWVPYLPLALGIGFTVLLAGASLVKRNIFALRKTNLIWKVLWLATGIWVGILLFVTGLFYKIIGLSLVGLFILVLLGVGSVVSVGSVGER